MINYYIQPVFYTHTHSRIELPEGTTSITLFDGFTKNECRHFKYHLNLETEKFVVTKEFRKVLDQLNSEKKTVSMGGPKGVGKSMSLAAIATLCHGKRPCFLWSPYVVMDQKFHLYAKDIVEKLTDQKFHLYAKDIVEKLGECYL